MGNLKKKVFKRNRNDRMVPSHSTGGGKLKMTKSTTRERTPKPKGMSIKSSRVLVDERTKGDKERDENMR